MTPGAVRARTKADVTHNCARFGRKAFGSVAQMRVSPVGAGWRVEIRAEGHPVHEAAYVTWMTAQWQRFFVGGFGVGTRVTCQATIEAGSRQDGRPAEQLIVLPTLQVAP